MCCSSKFQAHTGSHLPVARLGGRNYPPILHLKPSKFRSRDQNIQWGDTSSHINLTHYIGREQTSVPSSTLIITSLVDLDSSLKRVVEEQKGFQISKGIGASFTEASAVRFKIENATDKGRKMAQTHIW